MSVLKYFKNTPGRLTIGRQVLSVIFFLQIRNEVPGKKRPYRPPSGDRWAQPTGAAGGPVAPPPPPRATGGPVAPRGRPG